MAKRRYRRFRRRAGKWSANLREISRTFTVASSDTLPIYFSGFEQLCLNPIQSENTVSQIFKVKNFNIDFVLEANDQNSLRFVENVTAYIMYVPQGYTITDNFNIEHPEYILTYKYLGSPTTYSSTTEDQQYQPIRIRSRMSRKLQTGDKIVLFLKGVSDGSTALSYSLRGLVRWWSKAC